MIRAKGVGDVHKISNQYIKERPSQHSPNTRNTQVEEQLFTD